MIFTAIQVARSQSTSQEFKAYKAENLAPAVVSDTRIYAIPTSTIGVTRRHIIYLVRSIMKTVMMY
jgi:hypothetical protein